MRRFRTSAACSRWRDRCATSKTSARRRRGQPRRVKDSTSGGPGMEIPMALPTYGTMAVDWEARVDFDRLRRERLARTKELMAKSEMGALLCFDMNNVRYLTATHIGTWAQDKCNRFTLLPQKDEPILWDFGSAARHHQLHCPWLGEGR